MRDNVVIAMLAWGWSTEPMPAWRRWLLRATAAIALFGVLEDLIIAAPAFLAEHMR